MVTPFAGVWIEIEWERYTEKGILVTPFAGVWIEIRPVMDYLILSAVTPFAGVWIEINACKRVSPSLLSLPLRECGLKSTEYSGRTVAAWSLPLRECGLKYVAHYMNDLHEYVTPFAGVWIEICAKRILTPRVLSSLPLRECGLK